jgi:hypothetical protein
MTTSSDYYEILGVSRGATLTEIKSAFRKLAREYHPDFNSEPGAKARFQDLNDAYMTLSDVDKRSLYDRTYVNSVKKEIKIPFVEARFMVAVRMASMYSGDCVVDTGYYRVTKKKGAYTFETKLSRWQRPDDDGNVSFVKEGRKHNGVGESWRDLYSLMKAKDVLRGFDVPLAYEPAMATLIKIALVDGDNYLGFSDSSLGPVRSFAEVKGLRFGDDPKINFILEKGAFGRLKDSVGGIGISPLGREKDFVNEPRDPHRRWR